MVTRRAVRGAYIGLAAGPKESQLKRLDNGVGVGYYVDMTTAQNPRPTYVTLGNGIEMVLVDDRRGTYARVDDADYYDEGPTCTLCDGLGHGYPGAGPCPLEERGGPDLEDEGRERWLESLAVAR